MRLHHMVSNDRDGSTHVPVLSHPWDHAAALSAAAGRRTQLTPPDPLIPFCVPSAAIPRHEDPSCPSAHEELLLSLRLLRNCCAAGRAAAACLMRCGLQCVVPAVAAELQTHLKQQPDAPSLRRTELRQLLLSCVQLLANFSVASGAAAEALWHECFPLIHEQLTDTHDGGQPCIAGIEPSAYFVAGPLYQHRAEATAVRSH